MFNSTLNTVLPPFPGRISNQQTGIVMRVFSDQPGFQFYTANFLPNDDSLIGKAGNGYRKHAAFCVETQHFPNAINQVSPTGTISS